MSTRGATFGVATTGLSTIGLVRTGVVTAGLLTTGLLTTARGAAICVLTDIIGRLIADGLKIIGALMTPAVTAAMRNMDLPS